MVNWDGGWWIDFGAQSGGRIECGWERMWTRSITWANVLIVDRGKFSWDFLCYELKFHRLLFFKILIDLRYFFCSKIISKYDANFGIPASRITCCLHSFRCIVPICDSRKSRSSLQDFKEGVVLELCKQPSVETCISSLPPPFVISTTPMKSTLNSDLDPFQGERKEKQTWNQTSAVSQKLGLSNKRSLNPH